MFHYYDNYVIIPVMISLPFYISREIPSFMDVLMYDTEFEYFSDDVKKCFSDSDQERINEVCNRYEYLSTCYPVDLVLVHADLHFGNMMFDTANKKIVGLIDWGAAHLSEPSRDMHYYYGDGAKDFLAGYGDNGDPYLVERQKFQAIINFLSNISEDIKYNKSPDRNVSKLLGIL